MPSFLFRFVFAADVVVVVAVVVLKVSTVAKRGKENEGYAQGISHFHASSAFNHEMTYAPVGTGESCRLRRAGGRGYTFGGRRRRRRRCWSSTEGGCWPGGSWLRQRKVGQTANSLAGLADVSHSIAPIESLSVYKGSEMAQSDHQFFYRTYQNHSHLIMQLVRHSN